MKKKRKSDIVVFIASVLLLILILDQHVYNDMVQYPFNSASPRASGKLFHLLLYKIDQGLGKTGILILFGSISLWYLYMIIKSYSKK